MSRKFGMNARAASVALLALGACLPATARAGTTTRDVAPSPPADTATTRFTVDGLTVILRRNTGSEVVAANLYLLGGTRQVTPATAGIETLLLAASERGTRRYPAGAPERLLARLGSAVVIDAEYDWTVFGLRTIRSALDSSWSVFADRVMAPTLAPSDVELVRGQLLAGARNRRTDPDDEVEQLADSVTFAGHPYAIDPDGTERSIESITPAMLRAYHSAQMVTSRMLLVVVGHVDRAEVERLVRRSLATLPRGSYRWTIPSAEPPATGRALIASRALPTNYLLGYFLGPSAASADYPALRVATAVLAGSLFSEIRTRRQLSYAAGAPFVERAVAVGGVYVSTVSPAEALAVMREEIATMKRELLEPSALARLVQRFITDYYMKNETNADQANGLARAELYRGDYRAAFRFEDELRSVTPEAVRAAAQRYMRDFHFAYLGDPARVRRESLERF